MNFSYSANGTSGVPISGNQNLANVSTTKFIHLAVTRDSSNDLRIFINGAIDAGPQAAAVTLFAGTAPFQVGKSIGAPARVLASEHSLDSVRITKGVARYTAAFSPPPHAFANN